MNKTTLEFTGHSDDIVNVKRIRHVSNSSRHGDDNKEDEDEVSAYGGDKDVACQIKVSNIGGSRACIVNCIYDGTWSFAPAMLEEERSIPAWSFTVLQPEHKYSVCLRIEASDDELVYERVGKDD